MKNQIHRFRFSLLAVLVVGLAFWSSVSQAYLLYKPSQFDPKTAKLLVVIHGCLQSAETMAMGSGFNEIAEKNNLAILYPQVKPGANAMDCWSWFLPENQKPDSGELFELRQLIHEVATSLKIDISSVQNRKVMIAGLSSGGATVAGLMACFPDDFLAAAIHSAPSYGLVQNQKDAEKILKDGPPPSRLPGLPCAPEKFSGRLIVIHGSGDTRVDPKHAPAVMADFLPQASPADSNEYFENNRSYTVTRYNSGTATRGHLVVIKQLSHAWSGHNLNLRHAKILAPLTQVPFFADSGPSATNLIWAFFKDSAGQP